MSSEQDFALAAGASASEATTELLRFAREGEHSARFAFECEVVTKLADALRIAAELEQPRIPTDDPLDVGLLESLGELHAGLIKFLAAWA